MKTNLNIKLTFISLLSCILFAQNPAFSQEIKKWIAPASADQLKNPVSKDAASLADAKKIYDNLCWTCHGIQGKGDGPASINLKPKPADHTSPLVQKQSDGAIFWKIAIGNGNMLSYSRLLSSKQRWLLVNYIRTLPENSFKK